MIPKKTYVLVYLITSISLIALCLILFFLVNIIIAPKVFDIPITDLSFVNMDNELHFGFINTDGSELTYRDLDSPLATVGTRIVESVGIAWNEDGSIMAFLSHDGTNIFPDYGDFIFIDQDNELGNCLYHDTGVYSWSYHLEFTNDYELLGITSDSPDNLAILNLNTCEVESIFSEHNFNIVGFTRSENHLFLLGYYGDQYSDPTLYQLVDGQLIPIRSGVDYVDLSPSGDSLVFTTVNDELFIYDIDTGASSMILQESGLNCANWSPDGTQVAFGSDYGISIVQVDSQEVTRVIPEGTCPSWQP